jgi:hypothetical protein
MPWHTIKSATETHVHVSKNTFRSWLKAGLEHVRLPSGTILVSDEAIDSFLKGFLVSRNQVDEVVDAVMKGLGAK